MKFRKKPVVVEAVQLLWSTWTEMCEFIAATGEVQHAIYGCYVDQDGKETSDTNGRIGLKIPTSEGTMLGIEGDWIIRGTEGELYPCKPAAFAATFEPVGDAAVDWVDSPGARPREVGELATSDCLRSIDSLPEDKRVDVIAEILLAFCEHCGVKQDAGRCQCSNDE